MILALSQLPKLEPKKVPVPEEVQKPDEHLKRWLTALNFDLSSKNWNAYHSLHQMIMKSNPTQREMDLFQSVIEQTLRRLDESASDQ